MKIDVYTTPAEVSETALQGNGVVVMDILRAGTTICQALRSGCKEIIPVASIEQAIDLAGNLIKDKTLLCGERNGIIIPGFNLGNSPFEYTSERVAGKSLIFTTTNGTVALDKAKRAREVVIGGFVNFLSILEFMKRWESDISLLCAGDKGRLSLEDSVCAGMFVWHLKRYFGKDVHLTDSARAVEILYGKFKNKLGELVSTTAHGLYLRSIKFEEDVKLCAQIDALPIIPIYRKNKVVRYEEAK